MSDWISVNNSLPKESTPVIAVTLNYTQEPMVVPARYQEWNQIWLDIDNVDGDGDEHVITKVTHWMPLPEPPQ